MMVLQAIDAVPANTAALGLANLPDQYSNQVCKARADDTLGTITCGPAHDQGYLKCAFVPDRLWAGLPSGGDKSATMTGNGSDDVFQTNVKLKKG
jgi:hypothetical protein